MMLYLAFDILKFC